MKLLIIEACTIAGEEVSRHAEIAEEIDVPKDDAATLTRMGRALYLDKGDDPTKGTLTATAEDKANVKKRLAAVKADREQRELAAQVQSPAGMAAMVAQAVAEAVKSAMAKPAA